MANIYQWTPGLPIALNSGMDVSTADKLEIEVRRPDGTVTRWPAEVMTKDGRATWLRYITDAKALDQVGTYKLQALVSKNALVAPGKTATLEVLARFS